MGGVKAHLRPDASCSQKSWCDSSDKIKSSSAFEKNLDSSKCDLEQKTIWIVASSSRSFQKFQGSQIAALLYRYKSLSKWRQSIQTLQRRLADFKRGIIDTENISPTIIVLVIKIYVENN